MKPVKHHKYPRSTAFTARANPRRYLLSGIPPTLWDAARARARREHVSMRALILQRLTEWLSPSGVAETNRTKLLEEIEAQYRRRQQMYEEAGGNPAELQGDLTCYLPYDRLRPVFDGQARETTAEKTSARRGA